jgi:hypothetical protein
VFVDKTVPAGTGVVEYQVQAARTTSVGPVANYHFNLGVRQSEAAAAMKLPVAQLRPARRSRKRRAA